MRLRLARFSGNTRVPETGLPRRLDQGGHGDPADAKAAMRAAYIDRELADPAIAAAVGIGVRHGVSDHLALGFDDADEGVGVIEPSCDVRLCARLRLEGGDPVLDALVVDLHHARRVVAPGRSHRQGRVHGSLHLTLL